MNANTTPIRVVLIDSHRIVLDALAERINAEPGMRVAGTALSGDSGLSLIRRVRPDVALLEIDVPGRSGFAVAEEISLDQPRTRAAFLTAHLTDIFLSHALRIGIKGYLLKSDPVRTLLATVRRIHAGETCYSRDAENRLSYDADQGRHVVRTELPLTRLTGRQLEVLRHLARGDTVKAVADVMGISTKSVESHKYRVMEKLDIHDRVELARYAIREGLVLP